MSPFQALYGFPPPLISELAIPGPDDTEAQDFLTSKQQIIQQLKNNLVVAQNRMKKYADTKRVERSFQVGDPVYLKMAPYRLAAFGFRGALKLQTNSMVHFWSFRRWAIQLINCSYPAMCKYTQYSMLVS